MLTCKVRNKSSLERESSSYEGTYKSVLIIFGVFFSFFFLLFVPSFFPFSFSHRAGGGALSPFLPILSSLAISKTYELVGKTYLTLRSWNFCLLFSLLTEGGSPAISSCPLGARLGVFGAGHFRRIGREAVGSCLL